MERSVAAHNIFYKPLKEDFVLSNQSNKNVDFVFCSIFCSMYKVLPFKVSDEEVVFLQYILIGLEL